MPSSTLPLKLRMLSTIAEAPRKIAYFGGHKAKVLLEMLDDDWVKFDQRVVHITNKGQGVLRLSGAKRRMPPVKLLWWIGGGIVLLLLGDTCIYTCWIEELA